MQRAVHWAFVRYFEQLGALCLVERPGQLDLAFDLIDLAIPGFALGAVLRVDFSGGSTGLDRKSAFVKC